MTDRNNPIQGKGGDYMLPERGNPFDVDPELSTDAIVPDPDRLDDYFEVEEEVTPETYDETPKEITPDELAALYPSLHSERNKVPGTGDLSVLGTSNDDLAAKLNQTQEGEAVQRAPSDTSPSPAKSTSMLEDVPEDDDYLDLLVDDETVSNLWGEIDDLEKRLLRTRNGGNRKTINQNLRKLKAARNRLMGGPQYYDEAEQFVAEVEATVRYQRRVRRWTWTWGLGLLVSAFVWLALVVAGVVAVSQLVEPTQMFESVNLRWLLYTVLAGVFGGVTNTIRTLIVRVGIRQDFDPQKSIWYLLSPIIGGVLGIGAFLLFQLAENLIPDFAALPPVRVWAAFVVAWLAGFFQSGFYGK